MIGRPEGARGNSGLGAGGRVEGGGGGGVGERKGACKESVEYRFVALNMDGRVSLCVSVQRECM